MPTTTLPVSVTKAVSDALEWLRREIRKRLDKSLILVLLHHDSDIWFAKQHPEDPIKLPRTFQTQITTFDSSILEEMTEIHILSWVAGNGEASKRHDTIEIFNEQGNTRSYEEILEEVKRILIEHWL